jgi:hypothetical protein
VGSIKPSLVIRWGPDEKRGRKQAIITYLSLLVFSFVMVGVTAPPTSNTAKQETQQQPKAPVPVAPSADETKKKQQQEAFLNWYAGLDIQIKNFDNASKTWTETFNALGNNTIGRHQAYSQLKPLQDTMSGFMTTFNKMEPPAILSKEHQKLLKDGTQDFSTMAYCRKNAVEKGLKFIDDMKPSSMQEAMEEAKSASAYMIRGAAKLATVRTELGLVDNKQ